MRSIIDIASFRCTGRTKAAGSRLTMLNIIDHGEWVQYTPDPYPFPPTMGGMTVMFARRVSDGRDWYDLRKELTNSNSIWMTLTKIGDDSIVMATTDDVSTLCPATMQVIEVIGLTEPHESFRQKKFDPKAKSMPFLYYTPPQPVELAEILAKELLGWDAETIRRKLEEANRHMPKLGRPPNG